MVCEDGSTAEWNIDSWGLVNITPNGSKKIKCNIDFKEEVTLVKYLKNLNSEELVEDDYGNLRYIGANPNNYVRFNNELWRIIGVMKDIENVDGSKEDKVKLIRSESIGNYSWDNSSQIGKNRWSISTLQEMLNEGTYWNRTSGDCPSGEIGASAPCDFSESGLTEDAKEKISISSWNLGGRDEYIGVTLESFYASERSETVYLGKTKWTGKVGLMYPSDYLYATSGGSDLERKQCLKIEIHQWKYDGYVNCRENDWLYYSIWTLTQNTSNGSGVFNISPSSGLRYSNASNALNVAPVIYLDSKLKTEKGNNGSSSLPFILK